MESGVFCLRNKRLEQFVVNISAKIADVIETAQKRNELPADSQATLIQAHLDLEELYVQLDPFLNDH
ncbi:MAG: hypothetical protein FWD25_11850 [Clostridia bacterium]|nr:hypothetical protein [Clostridia bacterium]